MSTYFRIGRAWVVIAVLVSLSTAGRAQGQHGAASDRLVIPALGTFVPMDDLSGRPIVDVWLNGQGPFPFVIGTAATVTTVSQDLLDELGLISASDQLAAGPIVLDELRVGEAVAHAVPVGRGLTVVSADGPAPRGVLSPTAFPGALVVLDYPASKLRLLPGALPAADGHRVFDYPADDPVPTIPIDVAGHTYDVEVDSTAPAGLTLPTQDEADLPLADAPIEIGHVTDIFGDIPVSVATLNGVVTIGDSALDIHSIVFTDARPLAASNLGTIGARILEGFVLTLDPRNHRVAITRPGG